MRPWTLVLTVSMLLLGAASARAGGYHAACPEGASSLLGAGNASGELLVTWQEARVEHTSPCTSSLAFAATGSPAAGFTDSGAISAAGKLSFATGAFLDDAGDGWVVGVHELFNSVAKYGPQYTEAGAWLAFRPAAGSFRAPVELPSGGSAAYPLVAGDQAGAAVVAWNTSSGAYLAWGSPAGQISQPRLYGREFRVSAVGMDEAGQALIAGYYPAGSGVAAARSVATISGANGSFSRPRVLATRPREPRRHIVGVLGPPLIGVGPDGQAVIAWQQTRDPSAGGAWTMLDYRNASGHFKRPVRAADYFPISSNTASQPNSATATEPSTVTVDSEGYATIVTSDVRGLFELSVAPSGRVGSVRRVAAGAAAHVSLAGNAAGQTALVWLTGEHTIDFALGNARGGFGAPQAIADPAGASDSEPLVTIDARGNATAIWIQQAASGQAVVQAQTLTGGAGALTIAPSLPGS